MLHVVLCFFLQEHQHMMGTASQYLRVLAQRLERERNDCERCLLDWTGQCKHDSPLLFGIQIERDGRESQLSAWCKRHRKLTAGPHLPYITPC